MRRPTESHVPAGRVPGHLQRARHAALNGAGAVATGYPEGVVFICPGPTNPGNGAFKAKVRFPRCPANLTVVE